MRWLPDFSSILDTDLKSRPNITALENKTVPYMCTEHRPEAYQLFLNYKNVLGMYIFLLTMMCSRVCFSKKKHGSNTPSPLTKIKGMKAGGDF